MEQPEIRFLPNRDLDSRQGKTYMPMVKTVEIDIDGVDTDVVLMPIEAGCFAQVTAVIITALNGTTPTADIGIASDEDCIIDNTAWDETAVGAIATGSRYFATADDITIDTGSGAADLTAGLIKVILHIYDLSEMFADPNNEVTVTTPA